MSGHYQGGGFENALTVYVQRVRIGAEGVVKRGVAVPPEVAEGDGLTAISDHRRDVLGRVTRCLPQLDTVGYLESLGGS